MDCTLLHDSAPKSDEGNKAHEERCWVTPTEDAPAPHENKISQTNENTSVEPNDHDDDKAEEFHSTTEAPSNEDRLEPLYKQASLGAKVPYEWFEELRNILQVSTCFPMARPQSSSQPSHLDEPTHEPARENHESNPSWGQMRVQSSQSCNICQ